jgi:hypothetical protein
MEYINRGVGVFDERIYDVDSTHTLSVREYVLIHIIYSLHLYNEDTHTHTHRY